jgi:hypothetical protein
LSFRIEGRKVITTAALVLGPTETRVGIEIAHLKLELNFSNKSGEDKITPMLDSSTTLRLTFDGFKNPLGTTWNSDIGEYEGRTLKIGVYVQSIGSDENPPRLINITLSA